MQIDRVLYPIMTLGPGKRIGIWTIGCPHHCAKCSNPELWETDKSRDIEVSKLILHISQYKEHAAGVTITGGDPFWQPDELFVLLKGLRKLGLKDILVYTGYRYEEIKEKYSNILSLIDVLIDEPYIDKLNNNIGIMGSSNQNIILLNNDLLEKYEKMAIEERKRQNFIYHGKIISVGIPQNL